MPIAPPIRAPLPFRCPQGAERTRFFWTQAACPSCPATAEPAAGPLPLEGWSRVPRSSRIPFGEPKPILRAPGGAIGTRLLPSIPGRQPRRRLALAPPDSLELALRDSPRGFPVPAPPRSASGEPRFEAPHDPRSLGAPRGRPLRDQASLKLANLARGGALGVCPSPAGRCLRRGR